MGHDNLLIERLIATVKKNPIVYDMTLPEYKNTYAKKQVWEAIAKEIGGKNGEAMCWKWKNLRDSYAKHRKNITAPNDEPVQKFVNWRWAPYMTFLDGHLRRSRDILAADHEDAEESNTSYRELAVNPFTDNRESTDLIQDASGSSFYTFNRNRKRRHDSPDGIVIEHCQQEPASSEKLDIIDYLFLNYADTFKKLSPVRQALLKLQMAKMFAEAELQELERDPIKFEPGEETIT